MDILEEIDEKIQDKKKEWDYRPMREKNETDALIDELLREFSAESSPASHTPTAPSSYRDYNQRSETEERREYEASRQQYPAPQPTPQYNPQPVQQEQSGTPQPVNPQPEPENNEMTQVFSRKDIEEYEKSQQEADGSYSEYDGSQNDNYSGSGGFDDDYYDENDFNDDCESLQPEDLDEEEYAEFEDYMTEREQEKNKVRSKSSASVPKKIWRIVYTALIAAFTIIGIFSSGLYLLEKFEASPEDKKAQDEALKAEIAQVVYPVAATGTDDFAAFEEISDEQLVALSLYEIIINGDVKVFKDAETEEILIPHTQVEYVVEKLFGKDEKVEPSDVKVGGVEIKYDKDSKSYVIPENHNIYTVYPVVAAIDQQGETYNVSVKYYKDGPQWTSEKKTSPEKTVVFSLRKTSDYYNIISAITAE